MRLIIATKNDNKVREIKSILSGLNLEIISLNEMLSQFNIEETGDTFLENAKLKARQVSKLVKGLVLADDSGLEVKKLGGRPGVFSARYAGPDASDGQNIQRLLAELKDVPWQERGARFRCIMVLIDLAGQMHITEGICNGIISFESAGGNGFGYDPIFYIPEYKMTMAQLPLETKNRISHRAKALEEIKRILERL